MTAFTEAVNVQNATYPYLHALAFVALTEELAKIKGAPSLGLIGRDASERSKQYQVIALLRTDAIRPAMTNLACAIHEHGIKLFDNPPTKLLAGVEYVAAIGPLRMVTQYRVMSDTVRLQFDIFGATE